MAQNILMPALSPTMTEGKLASWAVSEGDEVQAGDVIAEIETDKATMEVEAVDEGRIGKLLIEAGTEGVPVNQPIAILLEENETLDEAETATACEPVSQPGVVEAVNTGPSSTELVKDLEPASRGKTAQISADGQDKGLKLRASPLAKRLAKEVQIDLAKLTGTGPKGRILAADVREAAEQGLAQAESPSSLAQLATAPTRSSGPSAKQIAEAYGLAHEVLPVSKMRHVIAERLTDSKQWIPHFYLSVDMQLDDLLALRKQVNQAPHMQEAGVKVSVNDFIIKASALALMQVKAANASWDPEGIVAYENAHVAVAVAIDGGLVTPVVRLAEQKSLSAIAIEMKDLATRAREGKLKPEEYEAGTFSLSNMGMMGVKNFSAVINPPQSMILAVGAGEKRPVVQSDGSLGVATQMSVTLSCDHRVVDGALGAAWLQAFKQAIENPISMLV